MLRASDRLALRSPPPVRPCPAPTLVDVGTSPVVAIVMVSVAALVVIWTPEPWARFRVSLGLSAMTEDWPATETELNVLGAEVPVILDRNTLRRAPALLS
jgi:hypothetical protein